MWRLGDPQFWAPFKQNPEGNLKLKPCKRCTDAKMQSATKGDVGGIVARWVKLVQVVPERIITSSMPKHQRNLIAPLESVA